MKKLIRIAAVSLAFGTAPPIWAEKSVPTIPQSQVKHIESHLRAHQKYPATRAELIVGCYDLKDFSDAEKKWFLSRLPEGKYGSADEVMAALQNT